MEKRIQRLSLTTTLRSKEPTNAQTDAHAPNFQPSFATQEAVVPSRVATGSSSGGETTMNRSGRPLALGVK